MGLDVVAVLGQPFAQHIGFLTSSPPPTTNAANLGGDWEGSVGDSGGVGSKSPVGGPFSVVSPFVAVSRRRLSLV